MPQISNPLRDMALGLGAVLMGVFVIFLSDPLMLIAGVPYPLMQIVGFLSVLMGVGYIAGCAVMYRKGMRLGIDKETIYRRSEQGTRGEVETAASTNPPIIPPVVAKGSGRFSDEVILNNMPEGKYVKISYLIKALNVTDINDTRRLELALKRLVELKRVVRELQEGKSYYMRRE
jgi:hypothetical protein